ncbi:hypothetical protein QUB36_16000, partial [Microcoleus sp. AT8-B1]|uniref:hypothetical protein n=1 Tax=unclassified Microcoleus TaxID=2642155 RepID=UPI002FD3F7AB
RRGLKSPSNSKSRLKPTEEPNQTIAHFSPLQEDFSYETGISIPVVLGDSRIVGLADRPRSHSRIWSQNDKLT